MIWRFNALILLATALSIYSCKPKEDDKIKLEPGDTIWIPEEPPGPGFWEVFTDVLTILAQLAAIVAASAAVIVATR